MLSPSKKDLSSNPQISPKKKELNLKAKAVSVQIEENVIANLSKFIKHNKNLLHLDLSNTGLGEQSLNLIGTAVRRAKSLVCAHFSGNPGVTEPLMEFLFERLRCKKTPTLHNNISIQFENQLAIGDTSLVRLISLTLLMLFRLLKCIKFRKDCS